MGQTALDHFEPPAGACRKATAHSGTVQARLEHLYCVYGDDVRRRCLRLLRDEYEAEDATQQVFLSAYRSLIAGVEPIQAERWLMTIARNECLDRLRRPSRRELELGDEHAVSHDAFETLAVSEALETVRDTLGGLPAQQREAFALRELGGLSQREISSRMAISEAAVETLLVRARRQLRDRLTALATQAALALPALLARRGLGRLPELIPSSGTAKIGAAIVGAALAMTVASNPPLGDLHERSATPVHAQPAPRASGKSDRLATGQRVRVAFATLETAEAGPAGGSEHVSAAEEPVLDDVEARQPSPIVAQEPGGAGPVSSGEPAGEPPQSDQAPSPPADEPEGPTERAATPGDRGLDADTESEPEGEQDSSDQSGEVSDGERHDSDAEAGKESDEEAEEKAGDHEDEDDVEASSQEGGDENPIDQSSESHHSDPH